MAYDALKRAITREQNRETMRAANREAYATNPEKFRAQKRADTKKHRDKRSAERKKRYKTDKAYAALILARVTKYRTENAEKLKAKRPAKGAKYRAANQAKLIEARRKYWADRPGLQLYFTRSRQVRIRRATPAWANHSVMKEWYRRSALLGVEVDHIVPLHSPLVCGLHWEGNFQLLPAIDNMRKGNRQWPDMP